MRIAVVHDWLVTYGGAERVLEQIVGLYPQADIYCLLDFIPDGERDFILNKKTKTSFIQHLPLAKSRYRSYLPLMPSAIERFDLSGYDLVISSSHAVAKGVRTGKDQLHICYCYTPMRYAWDLRDQYLRATGLDRGIKGALARAILDRIREWDLRSARGVDRFIAISKHIAERIKRIYERESVVIYPPVDTDSFTPCTDKEDYYLAASRIVPYKRVDLIVEAFSNMPDRRLVVIGEGPELGKAKSKAGSNIEFLGYQPSDVMRDYMQRAKAFVFAAEEDFGIIPVEAQCCGTPVIAYRAGGVLETVVEGETGVFFGEQTKESIKKSVDEFEASSASFDPDDIRRNAERFGVERFRREFSEFVRQAVGNNA